MKSLQCPSCGHHDFDPERQCECGYQAAEPALDNKATMGYEEKDNKETREKMSPPPERSESHEETGDLVIKEIDSWVFTFSEADNCICLGTPALQSFKLKLTLKDLEELLEFLYQKTGKEKTLRKLQLSADEMPDLIDKVQRMIEEKRSKISIKLEVREMKEIADAINMKLKA